MRESKEPTQLRFELVRYARKHGVKPAARQFRTTPKTVRKWLARWTPGTKRGLQSQSRAPKNPARRITEAQRQEVIALKRRLPSWGAERLRQLYALTVSEKSIRAIWHQEGLVRTKRRKHRTKQNLRAVKAAWPLFAQTDLDTKDLDDIPEFWPQIRRHGLPLIQYTAREVNSGLMFIAFAQERSLSCASLFAELLLEHLQRCHARFDDSRWQTDNGSEFIGNWQARRDSRFTQTVEAVKGLSHHTIPPGAHTWQSDVETVHRLIEDEFYEVETFSGRQDFLAKAATYNLWFNVARTNSYKEYQTPWQIIHARDPTISPEIALWPPVFLDELLNHKLDMKHSGGYHVGQYP
jgi:transposase